MVNTGAITMDDLLNEAEIEQLSVGEVLEGTVYSLKKHEIWVDLGQRGFGVVQRREIGHSHELKEGESITASIVDTDTEEGVVLLSLKKAAKDRGWEVLEKQMADGETITVRPYDANRGGMLVEVEGIRGFLPVSQLSAENYPRVSGADKDEILQRLNALVKKDLKVKILDVDKRENKLIVSEKEALKEEVQKRLGKLEEGTKVKGLVTGVVDFGAFINVDGIEGLIHISEISWDRVENPSDYLKIGDEVEAKVIAIDKEKLSLSLKQMQSDPWLQDVEKFKTGDKVEGTITRITPFGAFVQVSPAVEALVHVSELGDDESVNPEELFKLNEKKEFTIIDIDKDSRKISLSLGDGKKSKTSK